MQANQKKEHSPATTLPLPAWWIESGDAYLYPNEAFCNLSGSPDRLTVAEMAGYLHPEDSEVLLRLLSKPGEPANKTLYFRLRNRHEQYRWYCMSWLPYPNPGACTGYLCLLQDIHDLYTQEEFFKHRFKQIFDSTFQFTGLTDPKGRLLEANKPALDFGGYTAAEVIGKPFWQAGWWDDSPDTERRLRQAIKRAAKGEFVRLQERISGEGEKEMFLDFSLKPLSGDDGRVQYLIAEGRDITELKWTKNKLRASEKKWRTLVENTPDIIVRHDPDLRYTFINQAIERQTGLPPAHYIGKLPHEVSMPQERVNRYTDMLQKCIQEKQQLEYLAEIESLQGPRTLFITIIPEFTEEDTIESLLVFTRDFTELREKEQQLAVANQELLIANAKLWNILDSTKDLICSRDLNMRLLVFNESYKKEFTRSYGLEPRLGQTVKEALSHLPAECESLSALWKRALKGEEFTILQELGDPRFERKYYEITLTPIYGEQGQLIGATYISHDITRQRNIEKELKDAREFLILAENIPHIIFTTNPVGVPDYLNQYFYEYTGLQEVDMEGPFGSLFIHPEELPGLRKDWVRAVEQQEGIQVEVRMRHHTGEYRWNVVRFIPLINQDGEIFKWIGSVSDIHEAIIGEKRERMAAQEFRQLADSLPQIIWTATSNGHTNYLNNKWFEYTGISQSTSKNFDWNSFVHPDDREQALQSWEYAVNHKEEYLIEYRIRNAEGQYRWFLGRGLPLYNDKGEVVKWFGSATDIHDQKLQNKRLWQQNLQLNQINQYLDNFVHTAAHDLRAPIANIKGLLSLISDTSDEKRDQITNNLKVSAERLDSTLQGMIQLIEAQSHTGDISRDIDIKEVFFETLFDFESELKAVGYDLETDFTDCPRITFVLPYLKSAFRNLISNSIKYRKPDEKLRLSIKCEPKDEFLLITFKDNGIGIDLERFGKNLFKPFRRFTQQAQGKGIGMHIVKNMLVKTGGKIEVKSSVGEGTTFLLYLKNQQDMREELVLPEE